MADLLAGYDMVVAISQNEVNSQFQRLLGSVIQPKIMANGLSQSGGMFGGGGSLQLSSSIRGFIDAPQVLFATQTNPTEVVFYFDFKTTVVQPADLGVTAQAMAAAFTSSPDNGTTGLLVNTESIPYTDQNGAAQTLAGQTVYYWLTQTQTKLGTTTVSQYSLVPALFYLPNGNKTMISLDGLRLSFQVLLNKIPATVQDIQAAVQAGTVSADVLTAIQNNQFDSAVFSLEQLFLDFDTTDFTQWNLVDPAGALGGNVTGMSINSNGTYVTGTQPLNTVLSNDPTFSTELSTNLQYVFGVQDKNTAGRTPYIVGINVSSTDPATSNPNQPASLVPGYIGYSTTPSPSDQGLSAIVYQILGGDNASSRVPTNNDGSVVNVSTNYIVNNDFSGEMLFDQSVFFDPIILVPIQQKLTSAAWTQSGSTWTASDQSSQRLYHHDGTELDSGPIEEVTQDQTNSYSIQVTGNKIVVSGSMHTKMTINIEWKGVPLFGTNFTWWKTGSLDWSMEIDMYVTNVQQLAFQTTPNFPQPTISSTQHNEMGNILEKIASAFTVLSGKYFDPFADGMKAIGDGISGELLTRAESLNQNLAAAVTNNFISPTGQVFLLNAPRFNEEFDLQMDVTYSV